MTRRPAVALPAAFALTVGLSSAGWAQSAELIADGRVEMPEHGYAFTFPDGWTVFRLDPASALQPIQAFGPEGPDGITESCNVQFGQGFGLSPEEAITFMESEWYDPFVVYGDGLIDGPRSSIVTLPVGAVLRLDVELMRDGTLVSVTSYTYDDGATVLELSCAGIERPADMWLPIAEMIEILAID